MVEFLVILFGAMHGHEAVVAQVYIYIYISNGELKALETLNQIGF